MQENPQREPKNEALSSFQRIYADHNASAPLRDGARAAMIAALERCGNPASIHAEGRAERALVEKARAQVAALCGAPARNVTFVSGASEAAATLLTPTPGPKKLVIFAGEHPCVRTGGRFAAQDVSLAPSTAQGAIDLDGLEALLGRAGEPALLALQAANNETGVIQPLEEASALVRARGGVVVCDAAQAGGRLPLDVLSAYADWIILSSHKLGGPKGAGAIIGREPFPAHAALIAGGGQERGARGGTENVPAIAGFGAAAEAALGELANETGRLAGLRDAFEAGVLEAAPDAHIFGAGARRLPNTSCLAVPGVRAETFLMALDLAGVAASSGSACSSGKVGRSPTLAAMGIQDELAACAMRFSLGWSSDADEAMRLTAIVAGEIRKLLARRSRSAA